MTPKKLTLIMTSILLLTIVGSGWLYVQTKEQLQSSVEAISGSMAELEQTDERIAALRQLEEEIAEHEEQDVDLSVFLPTAKGQSEAIDILLGIFNRADVDVSSFTFTPTEGVPNPTSQSNKDSDTNVYDLPVTIAPNQEIPFESFMTLLIELENSQRHVSIESLSIQSEEIDSENPQSARHLDVGLTVNVHYIQ